MNFHDERQSGETFEEYKTRLRDNAAYLKHRVKGVVAWRSTEMQFVQDDPDDETTKRIVVVGKTFRTRDFQLQQAHEQGRF